MNPDTNQAPSPAPRTVDITRLSSNRGSLAALGSILMSVYVIGGAVLTAYGIALLIQSLDSRNPILPPFVGGTYLAGGFGLILAGFFLQALCIWMANAQELLESIQSSLYLISERVAK